MIRVLHTPGHTPESLCLVVTDKTRGPEPWFVTKISNSTEFAEFGGTIHGREMR